MIPVELASMDEDEVCWLGRPGVPPGLGAQNHYLVLDPRPHLDLEPRSTQILEVRSTRSPLPRVAGLVSTAWTWSSDLPGKPWLPAMLGLFRLWVPFLLA